MCVWVCMRTKKEVGRVYVHGKEVAKHERSERLAEQRESQNKV